MGEKEKKRQIRKCCRVTDKSLYECCIWEWRKIKSQKGMNLGGHENNGDEGGKRRKEGRMERRKEGSIRTKEPEKISDILIFIFRLNIQSKCIVSRHQNSRTSEIEEKLRNEDVTFKVLQGKVHKKPGVQ